VANTFEVYVVTPEREVWSGRASILIARGTEGDFAIMAGHVPMLTELQIGPLFLTTEDGERIAAAVDGGFLHCVSQGGADTRVDVLAEHAELEPEIDLDRARRLKEDAERRIAADHDAHAEADLAKALTRINLLG
jgi:F-type H+-transporting ATPase subunit epsilon